MGKYLVLDTETTGGLANPLAYDVGGVVIDDTGYVWERFHWAVLEIIGNPQLMATAFYAEKMPLYWQEVYNGNIKPLQFADILRKLTALCDFHDIAAIPAYNMAFDNRSMGNTCEYLFNNRNWMNRNIPLWDIWAAACKSVLGTEKFIRWAVKTGNISEKGNPRTSAEVCFQYITGNSGFIEEHTGGRDAEIEGAILAAILRRKKRPDFSIIGSPWRIPAKKYKEMLAAGKIKPPVITAVKEEGPHHYQQTNNRMD